MTLLALLLTLSANPQRMAIDVKGLHVDGKVIELPSVLQLRPPERAEKLSSIVTLMKPSRGDSIGLDAGPGATFEQLLLLLDAAGDAGVQAIVVGSHRVPVRAAKPAVLPARTVALTARGIFTGKTPDAGGLDVGGTPTVKDVDALLTKMSATEPVLLTADPRIELQQVLTTWDRLGSRDVLLATF